MDSMIEFALMRHGELAEKIAKREAEIKKLREDKENLEIFVSTAKELAELSSAKNKKDRIPQQEEQNVESNPTGAKVLPVRQVQSA